MGGSRHMTPVDQTQDMSLAHSASAGELPYEPPRVEAVVTAAELERESLYAGNGAYSAVG